MAAHSWAQTLVVTPSGPLRFRVTIGGAPPPPVTLTVSTTGGPLPFAVVVQSIQPPGVNWLQFSPTGGVASQASPVVVTFTANAQGLSPRVLIEYLAQVQVISGGQVYNAAFDIAVNGNASLAYSPITLSFVAVRGDPPPPPKTVTLTTVGASWVLRYYSQTATASGANWLSATPDTSNTPEKMTVAVDHAALTAGPYAGAIAISDTAGGLSPPVAVNLAVEEGLTVSQSSLVFNVLLGSTTPVSQTVTVGSTGGPAPFSLTSSAGFVAAQQSAPTTNAVATVTVDPTGLGLGTHTATVTAASPSGAAVKTIAVTVNVTEPALSVTPAALTFNVRLGETAPHSQTISVSSAGGSAAFTASAVGGAFLSVQQSSPVTASNVTATIQPAGLGLGAHSTTVRLTTTGGAIVNVPVSVVVSEPQISISPAEVMVSVPVGSTAAPSQAVSVTAAGGAVEFTATAPAGSFASVQQSSPTTGATVTITVNPTGLGVGIHTTTARLVTAGGAVTDIPVTLEVTAGGLGASPAALSFVVLRGGPPPAPQEVTVVTTAPGTLFTPSASAPWVLFAVSGSAAPATLTVSVDGTSLAAGTHNTTLTLASSGHPPITIAVTVEVIENPLAVNPAIVVVQHRLGDPPPPPQTVSVTTHPAGGGFAVAAPGVPWLTVAPLGGTAPGSVQFGFDVRNLAPGTYTTNVVFTSGGVTVVVPVTVTVTGAGPGATGLSPAGSEIVHINPRLNFIADPGGANPPDQTYTVDRLRPQSKFASTVESEGGWLSLNPTGGEVPAPQTVRVNIEKLTAGGHVGWITYKSPGATATPVEVRLRLGVIPEVFEDSLANAGGNRPGPFAGGSLVTFSGLRLATAALSATTTPLPAELGGMTAVADGLEARIVSVSETQATIQLPYGARAGRTTLLAAVNGVRAFPVELRIAAVAPGLVIGDDGRQAVAHNADGSANGPMNPARGSLKAFLTGQGEVEPPLATGAAAPASPPSIPRLPVRATLAGAPARVVSAMMAPGLVGLLEVVVDTSGAQPGERELVVFVGDVASNAGVVYIGN
jgi:uncharacterized protein (TIGR03437 family)